MKTTKILISALIFILFIYLMKNLADERFHKPSEKTKSADIISARKKTDIGSAVRKIQAEKSFPVNKGSLGNLYNKYLNDIGLTPETAAKTFEILYRRKIHNFEAGRQITSDYAKPNADALNQLQNASRQLDEELKQLVGEQNFEKIAEWERTLIERKTIENFKQRYAEGQKLASEQEELLAAALYTCKLGDKYFSLSSDTISFESKNDYIQRVLTTLKAKIPDNVLQKLRMHLESRVSRSEGRNSITIKN